LVIFTAFFTPGKAPKRHNAKPTKPKTTARTAK
jgi:hypothetical protein